MHIALEDIDTTLARRIRPLTADEMSALEDSVLREGIMVPILVNAYGKLVDGYHRLQLALKHDLECPVEFLDETDETALARLAGDLNSCRRQMTKAERDAAIVEARASGVKIAEIAKELGVNPTTVTRTLSAAGATKWSRATERCANALISEPENTPQKKVQICTFAEPSPDQQPEPTPEPEAAVCEMQSGGLTAAPTPQSLKEPKLIETSTGRYEQSAPTEPAWMVVLGALVNLTERSPVSPAEFLAKMPDYMLRNPKTKKRIEGAATYLHSLLSYYEELCPKP